VAELVPPEREAFSGDVTELPDNAAHNPRLDTAVANSRAWRAAELPAGGGTGNARSVARVHTILAIPIRFGLGFAVGGDFMPGPRTLYWGGAGGSLAVIDMDARATYAYAMNKMGGGLADMRAFAPDLRRLGGHRRVTTAAAGTGGRARPRGR
jgi:hypothetical protein